MYFDSTSRRLTKCWCHSSTRENVIVRSTLSLPLLWQMCQQQSTNLRRLVTNLSNVECRLLGCSATCSNHVGITTCLHTLDVWLDRPTSSWHSCPAWNLTFNSIFAKSHRRVQSLFGRRRGRAFTVDLMNIVINPSCIDSEIDKREIGEDWKVGNCVNPRWEAANSCEMRNVRTQTLDIYFDVQIFQHAQHHVPRSNMCQSFSVLTKCFHVCQPSEISSFLSLPPHTHNVHEFIGVD